MVTFVPQFLDFIFGVIIAGAPELVLITCIFGHDQGPLPVAIAEAGDVEALIPKFLDFVFGKSSVGMPDLVSISSAFGHDQRPEAIAIIEAVDVITAVP